MILPEARSMWACRRTRGGLTSVDRPEYFVNSSQWLDMDRLTDGEPIVVVYTSGHAPEHVSLYCPDDRIAELAESIEL